MTMKKAALLFSAMFAAAGLAHATVDVNTATKEQLEAEGMGPVAAQAILDYRTKNGPFKSSDEVRKVISDAIAGKLNIGISISGPAPAKPVAAATPKADAPSPPKEAKAAPAPKAAEKPAESKAPVNDNDLDNVRNRAKKDADDRKT
jgi:competence protein ComEA